MEENFMSKMNTDFIFDKITDIFMSNNSINIKLNDKYKKIYEDNIKNIYDSNVNVVSKLFTLSKLLFCSLLSVFFNTLKSLSLSLLY